MKTGKRWGDLVSVLGSLRVSAVQLLTSISWRSWRLGGSTVFGSLGVSAVQKLILLSWRPWRLGGSI
jgi:hypothetical protein